MIRIAEVVFFLLLILFICTAVAHIWQKFNLLKAIAKNPPPSGAWGAYDILTHGSVPYFAGNAKIIGKVIVAKHIKWLLDLLAFRVSDNRLYALILLSNGKVIILRNSLHYACEIYHKAKTGKDLYFSEQDNGSRYINFPVDGAESAIVKYQVYFIA